MDILKEMELKFTREFILLHCNNSKMEDCFIELYNKKCLITIKDSMLIIYNEGNRPTVQAVTGTKEINIMYNEVANVTCIVTRDYNFVFRIVDKCKYYVCVRNKGYNYYISEESINIPGSKIVLTNNDDFKKLFTDKAIAQKIADRIGGIVLEEN